MQEPHFVLKRGHKGRYKFHLSSGGARLSGELAVELDGTTRPQQDAEALGTVRALAAALAEQASLPHVGTDDVTVPLGRPRGGRRPAAPGDGVSR